MKNLTKSNKELEAEKIAIEKQAYLLYNKVPSTEFDAYMQNVNEEFRLNIAENKDLVNEINSYISKKPTKQKPDFYNTGIPTFLTATAGGLLARILIDSGALEPNYVAANLNDLAGITLYGLAGGGIVGLIISLNYCTKPITRAIINKKIAKREAKIQKNKNRNSAISYLKECLEKEEASTNTSEFSKAEIDGQLEL